MHEASLQDDNCFITLTYDEENLPVNESLDITHFQKFMKRLRKHYRPKKIRFYHCGEYGEQLRRPHYHALLFNHEFTDLIYWKEQNGNHLYTSPTLDKLWGKGQCIIGDVTFDSAAYVSAYILKKQTGDSAQEHYEHVTRYAQTTQLTPEYTTMSRRPGIGRAWYEKYKQEVYPDNFIIVNGKKQMPPKYYQQFLEEESEQQFKQLKKEGRRQRKKNESNNTPERLTVRERCAQAKINLKTRQIEESRQ